MSKASGSAVMMTLPRRHELAPATRLTGGRAATLSLLSLVFVGSLEAQKPSRPPAEYVGDPPWLLPVDGDSAETDGAERDTGGSRASPADTGTEDGSDIWRQALDDPSLDGRLRLTYRLDYRATFFRSRGLRFPFAGDVTDLDRQVARELRELHDDNDDQDLDQYLALGTRDLFLPRGHAGLVQGLDTELSLRFFRDVGGTPPRGQDVSVFNSRSDGSAFQLRTLNARLEVLERHLEITAGRQLIESAEWVHIDGGRIAFRGLRILDRAVELEAFAGSRVTFYTSVSRRAVWGGTVRIFPTRDTQIELSDVQYIDNSFRAELFHRLVPDWTARLTYRQINEDPESVRLASVFSRDDWGLELRASYFSKLGLHVDDFNFDYTFSDRVDDAADRDHDRRLNIGDIKPYDEASVELRQELTQDLGAFLGATGHLVRGGSDRDTFNTNWYEAWAGIDTLHVPWEGLTGRLGARYLHTVLPRRRIYDAGDPRNLFDVVGDGEPDFLALELLLEQDVARRVAVGSEVIWRHYARNGRFVDLDGLDALALTGYLRCRPGRFISCYLSYTYERDAEYLAEDFADLHSVRVQVRLSF